MSVQPETSSPPPTREYSFGAKTWNFFVVVLIFLLIGPPVGAVVFLAMIAVWIGKGSDPGSVASVFAFLTLYGLLFSWFIGGLPAVLTGLAFAIWQTFVGPVRATIAAVAGIAAGLLLTLCRDHAQLAAGPQFCDGGSAHMKADQR